jgi:predicted ribosome quality control (RQC) complex YloA/Tae2 family protein
MPLFHEVRHVLANDFINQILNTLAVGVDLIQVLFKDFEQGVLFHQLLFGWTFNFQRASFEFMETLSAYELQDLAQWLQNEMQGAQLQDLWTNGQQIVLQFYKYKEIYLVIDAQGPKPYLAYLEERPPIQKSQKPLTLFLNSHAKNLRWEQCSVDLKLGRVIDLHLKGGERSCFVQIQLIPKAFNVLAQSSGKTVAWEKPRELPPSSSPLNPGGIAPRDWRQEGLRWLERKLQGGARGVSSPSAPKSDPRVKALEKKKKALAALREQTQSEAGNRWRELGELLKISDETPAHLMDLYDFKKSRTWNLENAFAQAKLQERKAAGTQDRIQKLEIEISKLESDLEQSPQFVPVAGPGHSAASRLMEKTESKGRKLALEDGIEALIGKTAKDNLAILRRAQAWDLWLHLKDYPGAHAIILRPRGKDVPQSSIQKVAEWLIKESLSHQKIQWGAKYDVVVVECRHVRPIKGDKLGRVTYHHPQVYSFASKT